MYEGEEQWWQKGHLRFGPVVVHFQGIPTPNSRPKNFGPPTPLWGDMIFQSFVTPKMGKTDFFLQAIWLPKEKSNCNKKGVFLNYFEDDEKKISKMSKNSRISAKN